jgi:hypothetical protein
LLGVEDDGTVKGVNRNAAPYFTDCLLRRENTDRYDDRLVVDTPNQTIRFRDKPGMTGY